MVAVDSEFKFLLDWLSSFRAVTDLGFPTFFFFFPHPQLASYPGKQGLGPVPTSPSAPSDSLKRAMVRDPPPSLSFRPAFQFKACLTFPHYPASQLGKGAGGV